MAKRKGSQSTSSVETEEPSAKKSRSGAIHNEKAVDRPGREREKGKAPSKKIKGKKDPKESKLNSSEIPVRRSTRSRKANKSSIDNDSLKNQTEGSDSDEDVADFAYPQSGKKKEGRNGKTTPPQTKKGKFNVKNDVTSLPKMANKLDEEKVQERKMKGDANKVKLGKKIKKRQPSKKEKRQEKDETDGSDCNQDSEKKIQNQSNTTDDLPCEAQCKEESSGRNWVTMTTGGKSDDSSDDSELEWEEVEEVPAEQISPKKSHVPSKSVEITVDFPDSMRIKKRKKKEFDLLAYFQRQLNRYNKEQRIEMHKTHLLCLLANGFYRNTCCNDDTLQSVALSIIPKEILKKYVHQYDVASILRVVKWFRATFEISPEMKVAENVKMDESLLTRFEKQEVASEEELVHVFVIILRVLQLDVRLVISLQPMAYKQTSSQSKGPAKRQAAKKKSGGDDKSDSSPVSGRAGSTKKNQKDKGKKSTAKTEREKKDDCKASTSRKSPEQAEEIPVQKRALTPKNDRKRRCASKTTPIIEIDSDEEDISEADEYVASSEGESDCTEKDVAPKKTPKRKQRNTCSQRSRGKSQGSKKLKRDSTESSLVELSSDSDFDVKVVTMATGPRKSAEKKKKQNKKVISSDSEQSVEIVKTKNVKSIGSDQWIEVYLPSDEKWVCVDCVRNSVNHPEHCEKYATQPLSYVLAFDNDNCVKDVTCRYASKWMSHTRKQRVDDEWWQETLEPYQTEDTKKNENEDVALQAQLQQQPLPTSIAEYKNHPLYALRRHLLKFEAFYPETPAGLGFCRGEPVYARECVHSLHTRETWLKEGRVVRIGEEAYKMVKARPKPKRNYSDVEKKEEPMVAVYGRWQTEEYIPPPAVDGIVPRNEHGNVELFLPQMLPKGTVHLQVPGLNRVARKLNIDCAPAMVGWDFHGGFSHPMFDGFVVCEEHKETLLDAWENEQQEIERKAREKREKRAMQNWKLLIKGLLIKERLKKRFQTDEDGGIPERQSAEGEEVAKDVEMSWPLNKQMAKKGQSKKREEPCTSHLFPFEKL